MPKSPAKSRNAAFVRQGGKCFYCGAPTWLEHPETFAARHRIPASLATRLQCTGEHLLARQDGGDCSERNIVAACRFCNEKRHQRPKPLSPDAYQGLVRRRIQRHKWHPPEILVLLKLSPGRAA